MPTPPNPPPASPDASSGGASPGAPPPALLRALRRLLGPVVRLLLRHGVGYPSLAQLLKSIYVEEAVAHFALPDRPQTISRLSLLTGIHRKDIKRLREESIEDLATPASVSLGAQLVLRWTAEPAYLDDAGKPRALPRLASDTDGASFESLVESVSKDIRPRAILDEWLHLGIARVDAEDCVRLVTEAFVPAQGFDEKAYYLGRNLHDHAAAAAHNLSGDGAPMLERNVYYAKLRPESVDELQTHASEIGMQALQEINRRARALQQADENASDATQRMSFGVYFYRAAIGRRDNATHASSPARDADLAAEGDRVEGGSDAG